MTKNVSEVNYDCKEILKLSFNNNYTNSTDAWVENMDSRWQDYLVRATLKYWARLKIILGCCSDGGLGVFWINWKNFDDLCHQVQVSS